jgi:GT2 family glycosyltransferase
MTDTRPQGPTKAFPRIRVQSIIHDLPLVKVAHTLEYLDNACRIARRAGAGVVSVAFGDCSPKPVISSEDLARLRGTCIHLSAVDYTHFDANLGSAAGHNRLLRDADTDFVMILNPDALAAPDLFLQMLAGFGQPDVGFVEARQLPVEHPKHYDPVTGDTSWASTACAMAPLSLFRKLGGFDAETFFLYCDDVDFSWRVWLAGFRVVHCPSATVFHDKRLSDSGDWLSSSAERYYSAEAGLLLSYKYSRADLTEGYLNHFRNSRDETLERAAGAFELRRKYNRLPTPIDADHKVGQFIDGNYAVHRFRAR